MDVLLVEDDPLLREMLDDEFAEAGFLVRSVATAEEGWNTAEQSSRPPSAVVTDINLPGADGLTLVAALERRWPHLAIFIITGDERNLWRVPSHRRLSCFLKPFSVSRLVEAIAAVLGEGGALTRVDERGGSRGGVSARNS
jgi:DNA-binding response OmpR family regulator